MHYNYDNDEKIVNLTIPGDILSSNVDSVRESIFDIIDSEELASKGYRKITLDLTAAKMIDSAGLNLLVSVLKAAKSKNAAVAARVANPHIQRTFSFTRLDKLIKIEQVETTTT